MAKKKEEKAPEYNWKEELSTVLISNMLKAGVTYYIESNEMTIKNEKDLEKAIKDYTNIKVGE